MKQYILEYDLDDLMSPAEGRLAFDEEGFIRALHNGVEVMRFNARDARELAVVAGVGCGLLFAKMKDESERVLCRFTMSSLKRAGEFCMIVNYFIQTGALAIGEEAEKPRCEKCGRPLVEGMKICIFCYNKLGLLKRTASLMKPFAKALFTAEFFLLISSILYLLVPVLNRHLIDNYLQPQAGTLGQIGLIALGMLLARLVGEIIFILSSRVFNKASMMFTNHLRNLAYEKIQKISLASLSKRTPGDLIRRVMEDTATIKEFMSDGGRWAVEQIITFAVVLMILLFSDARMTLIVFIPVPLVMLALSRFWKYIHMRYERQWRKNSKCQAILHDIIKGIRTVKSFGNEEFEIKKFASATKELADVSSGNEKLWALLFPALTFVTGIGEFMVLYLGGREILSGQMSAGMLVQFTMYITYIYAPLKWLVSFPRWLADAMTSMIKLFEILDEDIDIGETENAKHTAIAGEVAFEGISFGYKSYEPVLKDISLRIKPGEMIGIVGRSGSGKSTMINLLMRLYDPNGGAIRVNGTDLKDLSLRHLHENIGVVFQDTFLFAGTVYENVAYAKPGATAEEVIAACMAANAHDFIMKTSDGYDTLIGENGYSISGGERQRLAIARAIIKNPEILILDEATSSLDVETELSIQESLDKITKNRTTIAIAHRLSTLRNADRLFVLDNGAIAESGTHHELLKKKGIYYNLVMAQRQTNKMAKSS